MKKICGKKLAFLLVACVLATGTFVSCGDEETEEPTAADTLTKPTGTDPFISGNYTVKITATDKDGEYTYTRYYTIDTKERTVSIFYDEDKEEVPSQQKKYTYDNKTITFALYKAYMPSDMDAYIAHLIEDKDYTGDWKLAGKSEYVSAVERMVKEESSAIEKRLKDTTISTDERKKLQKRLDYLNSAVAEAIEQFNESLTYDYSKTSNVITLTNDAAEDKKLVLTPVSN